jgi:hypothetical protein
VRNSRRIESSINLEQPVNPAAFSQLSIRNRLRDSCDFAGVTILNEH